MGQAKIAVLQGIVTVAAPTKKVYLPGNGRIMEIAVTVDTLFDGGGDNLLDIGTAADADHYATQIDVSTAGVKSVTPANYGIIESENLPTEIVIAYTDEDADATAGQATVTITYTQE